LSVTRRARRELCAGVCGDEERLKLSSGSLRGRTRLVD
jgi:hypothetical protein